MKISKFFLHFFCKIFGQFNKTSYLCNRKSETTTAKIAQLVEHDLAKVGVAGSSPVFRSKFFEFDACRELKPQTPINMRK